MTFRTQTDTEVALRLYEAFGANCVTHMRGQFAFAIHDIQKNLVFMARDRMGVQPLYYAVTQSGTFVFASEIKALFEHPSIKATPDLMGVDAFLTLGYSPGSGTMFKGVHAVPPGHRLTWTQGLHAMIEPYWQWDVHAKPDPGLKSDQDYQERFDALLEEAVAIRQLDEAPLGAFATGSLESTAILSIMAKNSHKPPEVFTTAFGAELDGVPPGADVAAKIGCPHQQVVFEPEFMDRLPELVWALDQPIADPQVVMLHLLSRMASQKVKTVMSGAGANNLFVNYPQHDTLLAAHGMPKYFWWFFKETNKFLPLATIARKLNFTGKIGPRSKLRLFDFTATMRDGSLLQQYTCLSSLLDTRDRQELYLSEISPFLGALTDRQKQRSGWPTTMSALLGMQRDHLLQDGVLAPVNKLTGFNSLGTRMPLMDHKLIEFMLGVPDHLRRDGDRRKVLLRNYVDRILPGFAHNPPRPDVLAGQKSMLQICLERGPLREMAETCLSEASVRKRELFDPAVVRRIMTEAKAGESLPMRQVFALLTLELWFRIFIDQEKGWIST
jgi:asparagine synthase (glutamine-hydrolysing)